MSALSVNLSCPGHDAHSSPTIQTARHEPTSNRYPLHQRRACHRPYVHADLPRRRARHGRQLDLDYAGLIGLSLGGFIAFGACSLPAGWLGDTWSRRRMMLLFFFGIGAAALLTGLAGSVPMLVTGLTLIGVFAAIYHPVGTAMLVAHAENRGREIGINGMWGNLGVAFAALLTGFLTAHFGWRAAFILPGGVAILLGIGFSSACASHRRTCRPGRGAWRGQRGLSMRRVFGVLALVTATGGGVQRQHRDLPEAVPGAPERLAGVAADPWRGGQPGLCLRRGGATDHGPPDRSPEPEVAVRLPHLLPGAAAAGPGLRPRQRGGAVRRAVHVRGVRPGDGERRDGRPLRRAAVAGAGLRPALFPVVRCQRGGDPDDRLPGATAGAAGVVPGTGGLRRADLRRGAGVSASGAQRRWAPEEEGARTARAGRASMAQRRIRAVRAPRRWLRRRRCTARRRRACRLSGAGR